MSTGPRAHPVAAGVVAAIVLVLLLSACTTGPASTTPTAARSTVARLDPTTPPLVIGHRGASGYRPEHTLASYTLAAEQGADYIEPDLVSTKDGVLVARHENEISQTTDVADHPEFAARKTTKTIDGQPETGWFTEDFTLAELKTLRARERIPDVRPKNAAYDGQFEIPTFAEILTLRAQLSQQLGRPIGVYPETKHPTYFRSIGLALEPRLVADLAAAGLSGADAPVFIQSFELTNLLDLHKQGVTNRLVLLTAATGAPYDLASTGDARTFADLTTRAGLAALAEGGISAIGPDKEQVVPDGGTGTPTSLVADAHAAGLLVHPYTFRAENQFLAPAFRKGADPTVPGDAVAEQVAYLRAGVDGVFTDQPDIGVAARKKFLAGG